MPIYNLDYHKEKFGFERNNVEFIKGKIEDLGTVDFPKFDVVISNCVINLCQDKESNFRNIFNLLETGGGILFLVMFILRREYLII